MFKVERWNKVRWKRGEMHHSLDKCVFLLVLKVIETIWLDLTHRQIILHEGNHTWHCGTWEIILLSCGYLHIHKMGHIIYPYIKNILQNFIHGKSLWHLSKIQHRDCTVYFSKGKSANSINLCYHPFVNTEVLHASFHLEPCKQVSKRWKYTQKMCRVKWVWWLSSFFY